MRYLGNIYMDYADIGSKTHNLKDSSCFIHSCLKQVCLLDDSNSFSLKELIQSSSNNCWLVGCHVDGCPVDGCHVDGCWLEFFSNK